MYPQTAPERLRTLVTWLLGQSSAQGHRLIGERMTALDVGHRAQFALLAALAESGATSQADLGRRIGLDRSDVTAAIADMEARGLVERAPDPADRRRNVVRVSEAGTRFLAVLEGEIEAAQEDLLAPLSDKERRVLTELLARIVAFHAGEPGGEVPLKGDTAQR